MAMENPIPQVQQSIYTLQSQLDTIVYGLGAAQSTLESMRNSVNNWSQMQSLAPAQQQSKTATPTPSSGSTQKRAGTKKRVVSEATRQKLREYAAAKHAKAAKGAKGAKGKVIAATA